MITRDAFFTVLVRTRPCRVRARPPPHSPQHSAVSADAPPPIQPASQPALAAAAAPPIHPSIHPSVASARQGQRQLPPPSDGRGPRRLHHASLAGASACLASPLRPLARASIRPSRTPAHVRQRRVHPLSTQPPPPTATPPSCPRPSHTRARAQRTMVAGSGARGETRRRVRRRGRHSRGTARIDSEKFAICARAQSPHDAAARRVRPGQRPGPRGEVPCGPRGQYVAGAGPHSRGGARGRTDGRAARWMDGRMGARRRGGGCTAR